MLLELKNASLSLNGRQLFSHLSIMAYGGQITCITGPSGSGKTAMLRVMTGFLPLDEGLVSIDGELLTPLSVTTFRHFMAYLPQPEAPTGTAVRPRIRGTEAVWSPTIAAAPRPSPPQCLAHQRRDQPYAPGGTPCPDTADAPEGDAPYPAVCEEALKRAPIILCDDPVPSLLTRLKALAAEGRTVILASCNAEFINMSDKTIILGNDDNHLR